MNDDLKASPGALVAVGPVAHEYGLRATERLAAALGLSTVFVQILPAFPEFAKSSTREAAEQADFEMLENAAFSDDINRKLETTILQETEVLRRPNTFQQTLARAAEKWKAALVVLAGADTAQIECIREVAHACRRPVLLVRATCSNTGRVLVATSLSDDEVPVVRYGVDVAARLGSSVVVVHNSQYDAESEPASHADAYRRLRNDSAALALESGVNIDVVIARAATPEAAVLDLVATQNPEVLVLGSYPRTALTGWLVPSVSQAIIAGTNCNTVVLALGDE